MLTSRKGISELDKAVAAKLPAPDPAIVGAHLKEANELAIELLGNEKEGLDWILTTHEFLWNESPKYWICLGEGEKILNWLKDRLGR